MTSSMKIGLIVAAVGLAGVAAGVWGWSRSSKSEDAGVAVPDDLTVERLKEQQTDLTKMRETMRSALLGRRVER